MFGLESVKKKSLDYNYNTADDSKPQYILIYLM